MSGAFLSVLAESSLRAVALGLAGGAAVLLLRRAGAPVRHAVWLAVVCGMLALPLLPVVVRPLPVTVRFWKAAAPVVMPVELPLPSGVSAAKPAPRVWRPDRWILLWGIYLAGMGVLAVRVLQGARRLRRLCAAARPEYLEILDDLAPPMGLDAAGVEVRSTAAVAVPFTAGILRPMILLPADWRQWPAEKLCAVLAHELAHIARRDWLTARVAAANRCLFWFHPLAWWLERRLAALAEESADRAALAVLRDPRSYAGAILDFAFAMQGKRLRSMEATAMARSTKVGRRVERILAASQFSAASFGRGLAALIAACAIPLVYAAAALTPVPQAVPGEQISPPVRMYTKSDLNAETARQLEAALVQNPDDPPARMRLMVYYDGNGDREGFCRHAWWLIENRPERVEAVMGSTRMFTTGTEEEKARLASLWNRPRGDAAALANAGQVMRALGRLFDAEERFQSARRAAPDFDDYAFRLASLYVDSMIHASRPGVPAGEWAMFKSKATSELESTPDAAVTGAAGELLTRPEWLDLAEKCLLRAQTLDSSNQRWTKALARLAEARNRPTRRVETASPVLPDRVRVGANVQQTKLVQQVPPVYPPLAKQARIQGTVRLSAEIASDGTVKSINVVNGHPLLVPAAVDAVRQWVYQPTLLNETPVEVLTQIDVNFTLGDQTQVQETVEEGVARPTLVRKIEPRFPEQLRHQGLTCTVVLRVTIPPEGRVRSVTVERAQHCPAEFAESALEAVRQWEFNPATKNGQPVDAAATIEINFREK